MAVRKASSYSKKHNRPYTRTSKKRTKAYIKTVPYSKITKFGMGSQGDFRKGKHKYSVKLIAEENVLIRDMALEACRMLVHKILEEKVPGQYYLMVKVHPHHFIRENKTAAGAGADRLSSGMTHSYGIVIGRAGFVKPGKEVIFASLETEKAAQIAKEAFATIKPKIPGKTRILFEKLAD